MPQQTLDYRGPSVKRRWPSWRRVTQSAGVAGAVAVVVNLALIGVAARDRSWGALAIMILYGPIINGALILVSLGFIPLVKKYAGGAPIKPYVLTGVLAPLAAVLVDAAFIMTLDLHGC
jgi:hypothetical protein